jgi:glycosyltransferase involved in cell wall biosynthesis
MTKVKCFVLKHSDEVCPNSEATMLGCKAIYDREYTIIPMGIHMDKFNQKKPRSILQDKYELNDFTILFVGRLAEVKGVKYLLEAAKQIADRGMGFKLLVVGDGPLKTEFESFVNENQLKGQVIFVGWVDSTELNEYYNAADVFVGPSLSEPQGLVFVEALASGTPVVASNVGGIVDIVRDGVNGYLVEPGSSRAIAEKLEYLIQNRSMLTQLGKQARSSVVDRFSWQATVERYNDLFQKLNG